MTSELDRLNSNYEELRSPLDLKCAEMIESELYNNPEKLFEWASLVTKEASFTGNHTALTMKRYLLDIDSHDDVFDGIINYGKKVGIVSQVQTSDKGYTVAVVISMHLDSQGLGYKNDS